MSNSLINKLKKNLINVVGWRTKRKIVVIESDDWGAIRMPSASILKKISSMGVNIENCHYVRNDSLASEKDLELLFDVLSSFSDSRGGPPLFTANVVMANPDFEKIKADNYKVYHYEPFKETLLKYPEHQNAFNLWEKGMNENLFHPQYHGREHLQVNRWLKQLQNKESETFKVFQFGLFGLSTSVTKEKRKSFLPSYDWEEEKDREFGLKSIEDGLNLFETVFGFTSLSAIAPNYTWNNEVEDTLKTGGVRYLQGGMVQRSPNMKKNRVDNIRHYMGQENASRQIYMIRNCHFEPSSDSSKDWLESCLNDIRTAFFWNKPAIIESHRVNYIGFINPKNRDKNLNTLNQLLNKILQKWPDVEFMSSDQLGSIIENN